MNGSSNNAGTPFGGSSSLTVPSNHSTTMMTTSRPTEEYWRDDFRPLQDAGKHILGVLRKDESNPQGDLYRRIISKVGSGADPEINPDHHYFYPGIANQPSDGISINNDNGSATTNNWTFTPDSKESPIRHVGTVPLPPELQDRRKKVKISTMMGLFPQGELAWLTVDQTVFLWSYNSALDGTPDGASRAGESTQMMEFEMPSKQPIVSVGLAPPKPGVFNDLVQWCLVVTTAEEAILCVVAKTSHSLGAPCNIVPTKFVIPSDWISFLCVGASKNGRIFLGGQDGNLYELDYDIISMPPSNFTSGRGGNGPSDAIQRQLDGFYDGSDDILGGTESSTACPDVLIDKSLMASGSSTEYLTEFGKRAFGAAFLLGRTNFHDSSGSYNPPRKCRKLNHSSGGIWNRVLPSFVVKVGSFLSGDGSASGGSISQIVVDDERQLLYTLSSPKGWICVFDMYASPSTPQSRNADSLKGRDRTLGLAAVLDMPSTARSYLESVGRGRLNPTASRISAREGNLFFLGNSDAAQAGVGGMDGARRILRLVDSDKTGSQSANGVRSKRGGDKVNSLTPVSLEIIPCRESTGLTLLAVSAGGLRYYLSTLESRTASTGPSSSRAGQNPWKPQRQMTLYHIRAPPPLDTVSSNPNGVAPAVLTNFRVDASCYHLGTLFVAFEPLDKTQRNKGDALVAVSNDVSRRSGLKVSKDSGDSKSVTAPGGVCEQVSLNLSSVIGTGGGRIWDIEASSPLENKLAYLLIHSKSPTDSELSYVVPPFTPFTRPTQKETSSGATGSNQSIVSATHSNSMKVPAVTMFMNVLFGRPAGQGIRVQTPTVTSLVKIPSYRLSSHSGSTGFSKSAFDDGKQMKHGSVGRSPRLSSWLLRPASVPLGPLSFQHLEPFESTFVAVNVGGIHSYKYISALGFLREAILAVGANAHKDPKIGRFFKSYGFSEGCAMCFMLIVSPLSNERLKHWTFEVALNHCYPPKLVAIDEKYSSSSQLSLKDDPWIPSGFLFLSSSLCKGLYLAAARLLRPIWYKPAVVVTEGKMIVRGSRRIVTPAKVEMLLDNNTLNEVVRPLLNLAKAIEKLQPAVNNVPTRVDPASASFDRDWARKTAQRIEERNIHSLYRLLTRTTQLLNLFYHLSRADVMPDLPDVEWGLLHGIQFSQFVETSAGQERIENVLNKLVISMEKTMKGPSADANNVAAILSDQCYHYFSSGNRHAFLGFQAAQEAMVLPKGSTARRTKTEDAAEHLLKASEFWHSPTLITGQLLQTQESENFETVAERAMHQNSPLAKACSSLAGLEDVASIVHICLATASNFYEKSAGAVTQISDDTTFRGFYWEKGLYHKKHSSLSRPDDAGQQGKTIARGTNVTPKEAVNTCYSLIFYYLSKLLGASPSSSALGEDMVSVCAFQADRDFLDAFFAFMLQDDHKGVLFRLSSSSLQEWLAGKQNEDPLLLLNYYLTQRDVRAADLAYRLACDSKDVNIEDRIEYLVTAVSALWEAESQSMNVAHFKVKAEEQLELAKLQREFLAMTDSFEDPKVRPEGKAELENKLVIPKRLYGTYALIFHQFDMCLKIFKTLRYKEATIIKSLWKGVICECILPCNTRNEAIYRRLQTFVDDEPYRQADSDPMEKLTLCSHTETVEGPHFEDGSWSLRVEDTVVNLGRELSSGDNFFFFPLDFVASCLEDLRIIFLDESPSSELLLQPDWSFSLLLGAGAPFKLSFDAVYNAAAATTSGGSSGMGFGHKQQNVKAAVSILVSFAKGLQDERTCYENVRLLDVKATIDKVRIELQSVPEDVSSLESQLYAVEQASNRFSRR